MLLEHERNYALGVDALVTICSSNRNVTWFLERDLSKSSQVSWPVRIAWPRSETADAFDNG